MNYEFINEFKDELWVYKNILTFWVLISCKWWEAIFRIGEILSPKLQLFTGKNAPLLTQYEGRDLLNVITKLFWNIIFRPVFILFS